MGGRKRTATAVKMAALFCCSLSLLLTAAPASARVRLAITEFQVEGGGSAALATQLQGGFVLGLERGGLHILDSADVAKRLDGHPELQRCDGSPCFKAVGQQLDVKYLVTVKVDVAGNSYKTVARVFSTEGSAAAALPIATKSKTCDVCTVDEARESMGRLADILRPNIEEAAAPTPVVAARPAPPPSVAVPLVAAMTGAIAFATGFAVLSSNGSCSGSGCGENRTRNAVGGVLIGAGAAVAVMGTYVAVVRLGGREPVTGVAVAFNF
jgi:hypothetical protein